MSTRYTDEWYTLKDKPDPFGLTARQEAWIRQWAAGEGFKNLRGYASHLRSMGWDYYDVLAESP